MACERIFSAQRSEEHTSELQSLTNLVCRLLLGKKKHTTDLQSRTNIVCRLLLETETKTITSIILIKLIRVRLRTVRHSCRFKIVVIDIQITLKQMLRDFIGIRVNRAKKIFIENITNSLNHR